MNWERFLKVLFFVYIPGAIVLWIIYRALFTLSALHAAGVKWTQNNIQAASNVLAHPPQNGSAFAFSTSQNETNLEGGLLYAKWPLFFDGWMAWIGLPYILVSPGFYTGTFGPATTVSFQ